jgi:hypothetical protein
MQMTYGEGGKHLDRYKSTGFKMYFHFHRFLRLSGGRLSDLSCGSVSSARQAGSFTRLHGEEEEEEGARSAGNAPVVTLAFRKYIFEKERRIIQQMLAAAGHT